MFPPKKEGPPVGEDPEGAAIDMLVVGEPAPGAEGEEGAGEKPDPQVVLSNLEADLAQLRQLFPAVS